MFVKTQCQSLLKIGFSHTFHATIYLKTVKFSTCYESIVCFHTKCVNLVENVSDVNLMIMCYMQEKEKKTKVESQSGTLY